MPGSEWKESSEPLGDRAYRYLRGAKCLLFIRSVAYKDAVMTYYLGFGATGRGREFRVLEVYKLGGGFMDR